MFERSLSISFTRSVQKAELERFKAAESEGFREVILITSASLATGVIIDLLVSN